MRMRLVLAYRKMALQTDKHNDTDKETHWLTRMKHKSFHSLA